MTKKLHLVCNAHLDPYWQWEWEEGAAEALSTFRSAADLCEEYEGFIFNHNEVILYQWIEEYEPKLFERIQRLVREGKWNIMGGWYLQPDCNMPTGESFVRQILLGRTYFQEKFGARPTTAINFDPFGHSRGLVQILKKAGFDSYLFCRPGQADRPLEGDDFVWVGYDGSEIVAHRSPHHYLSQLGKAVEKIERWVDERGESDPGLVLWGVGNHGGGPSRVDLDRIAEYTSTSNERDVLHSTPEEYFADLNGRRNDLSRHADDLNPWGVGCYTSMIQIKQKHRQLEAAVFMLEKMASSACLQGLMEYPAQDVKEALKDLATAQFHDILPGSSIQAVEHAALRLLDHGLEICSRRKAQAFFALCTGQPKPEEGKIPIMVYNPHPYPLKGIWACEFQMPDMNWEDEFTIPHVFQNGKLLPCQPEKERSNFSADWRKRVVFEAELQPNQVTRFDCDLEVHPKRPQPNIKPENGSIRVQGDRLDVVVNCATGLLDKFAVDGVDMLHTNALRPLVMQDNEDPWGMLVKSYRDLEGGFSLMPEEEAAKFCAVRAEKIDAVRVIEDGPVRTVIEAALHYHNSAILQTYRIPKHGAEMEVEVRVHWNEKDRMLKWSVPTLLQQPQFLTQQAFGEEEQLTDGSEVCGLDWVALVTDEQALTVINDGIYGFDSADAELRLSLLRSPAYCGHPIFDRPIVQQDRYTPRIDQGERLFRFWISAGHRAERMRTIDRDALVHNEEPFTLSFFPSGEGEMPQPQLILEDDSVQLSAFKRAESLVDGDEAYVFRLFEPSGNGGGTTLRLPNFNIEQKVVLDPFEVKTFRFVPAKRVLEEVNIIEEPLET